MVNRTRASSCYSQSKTAKHLEENFDIYNFELEDEDFYAIDDLDKSMRVVNPNFAIIWN